MLYCRMGIKIATPNSEIRNYKIKNSNFRRETPCILLPHEDQNWDIEIENKKLKKEIANEKMWQSKALPHDYNAMDEKMWW